MLPALPHLCQPLPRTGVIRMTGITLLSIIAVACLVCITFAVFDIRDALREVRSMLRETLPALEAVIAKQDRSAVIAKQDRSFAGTEKAQQSETLDIANRAREQHDRESVDDLLRPKIKAETQTQTKTETKADPDEALPTASRLLIAWNEVRTKLLASGTLRGPAGDADGKGPK
jgi:crotonobetainyl-CoA:carnitine CoA-transferase CaiB-like acyl-CoA transferase